MLPPANVIFVAAGVLFLVSIVLDLPESDHSDTEPTQSAKGVLVIQDALVEFFDSIEKFFRRFELHNIELVATEAMKDVIVKIMVEVLKIFEMATEDMRQRLGDFTPRSHVDHH